MSRFSGSSCNATLTATNKSFQQADGLQQQGSLINWETIIILRHIIWYSALVLGIPGNVLSAIVWLRHHVANSSSSAVYLATLAIVNLVYLLSHCLSLYILDGWMWHGANYIAGSASILEPLLLLSFSVERLISVIRPLKVCQ